MLSARFRRVVWLACVGLVLSACAPTYSTDPYEWYEPPSGAVATIVGEESFALTDYNTLYVEYVDNLKVRDARTTGRSPLNLAAGERSVYVVQKFGTFRGSFPFTFEAKAGVAYRVRYERDESVSFMKRPMGPVGGPTFFWIEEAVSGKPVTERVLTPVDSDYRNPIFVPIFIRR